MRNRTNLTPNERLRLKMFRELLRGPCRNWAERSKADLAGRLKQASPTFSGRRSTRLRCEMLRCSVEPGQASPPTVRMRRLRTESEETARPVNWNDAHCAQARVRLWSYRCQGGAHRTAAREHATASATGYQECPLHGVGPRRPPFIHGSATLPLGKTIKQLVRKRVFGLALKERYLVRSFEPAKDGSRD